MTEDVTADDRWGGYSSLGGLERVRVNLRQHLSRDMKNYLKPTLERSEGKGDRAKPQR